MATVDKINRKGQQCIHNWSILFCQEGYCDECWIYKEKQKDLKKNKGASANG